MGRPGAEGAAGVTCAECGKRLSELGSIRKRNYPVYGPWDRQPRHEDCHAQHTRQMAYIRGLHVVGQLVHLYGPEQQG